MGEAEQSGLVRNAIVLGLVVAVAAIAYVIFNTMKKKINGAADTAGSKVDQYTSDAAADEAAAGN